jgi:hypothetical protein
MASDLGTGNLQRQQAASQIVHSRITLNTQDNEDHTFAGVMFDVRAKEGMPFEYLEINGIAVRGELGPITIWTTPETYKNKHESQEEWKCIHNQVHAASLRDFKSMQLDSTIRLKPGESCGLYVHSQTPGDDQIVYDNQRPDFSRSDRLLSILPGNSDRTTPTASRESPAAAAPATQMLL